VFFGATARAAMCQQEKNKLSTPQGKIRSPEQQVNIC